MADMLSFFSQFAPEPTVSSKASKRDGNSDVYMVISIVEAQDLRGDHFREDLKNGYGEVSTFCIVRYGDQEKRTDTQVETLHPAWHASFVFERDEDAKEVLFMFFSEDPTTGLSDLFGHIVIPLVDPAHPVPVNTPFVREMAPIAKCDSSALMLLRSNELNSPTWPELPKEFGGAVGDANVSVTQLNCNDLGELLKVSGNVESEMVGVKDVLNKVEASLVALMKHVAKVSKTGAKKVGGMVKDRRKNSNYPVQLSSVCEEEVAQVVDSLLKATTDRDELSAKTRKLESRLSALNDEKGATTSELSEKILKLTDDLADEKEKSRSATQRGDVALEQVASLSTTTEALSTQLATANSSLESSRESVAKLEETNKFLLRKGLEVAGSGAAVGFGFGSFFGSGLGSDETGAAAAGAFVADKVTSKDLTSEYDATALALRRCAVGASALTEYDAGTSTYSPSDLTAVLKENLEGTMRYLKGEYLVTDAKEVVKLGDALQLITAKVRGNDRQPVVDAFHKQLTAIRMCAQKLVFGPTSPNQFEARKRWPLSDEHVDRLTATDGKEVLKSLRLMAALFDNLGDKATGDLMYDGGVVKNFEFVIRLGAKAAELNKPKAGKDADFTRVYGVLTTGEAEELRVKFEAMGETSGESDALSKKTFKKLITLVCRDNGEKVPKDKDLDAVFDLADDDRSGTVDSEEFLKLYAAVKKGEVKGLGQKAASEQQAAEDTGADA